MRLRIGPPAAAAAAAAAAAVSATRVQRSMSASCSPWQSLLAADGAGTRLQRRELAAITAAAAASTAANRHQQTHWQST